MSKFEIGVISGKELGVVFSDAKKNNYALPAVNVTNTSTVNAVLETAAKVNSPVIIQFSNGGCQFFSGKGLSNEEHQAAIAGGISGAMHVHTMSELYGVTTILHTDHCARKLLPWVDGLLEAGEEFYEIHGKPLYSSHMIDLSDEPIEENIEICKKYLKRMSKIGMTLEIELGITGGEEDGVDNTDVDNSKLYTQPEEVAYAYEELMKISDQFTIAAAFGNVHGVYKPGNVQLTPIILKNSQEFIEKKFNTKKQPINFVFHGGSGSSPEEIKEDENAERYFEKALSSIGQEKGQIPTLIKCTALYESAKIYSRRKDYSKSIYYYRQFLSEYKTNPSFKVNLANVYLDLSFCAMFLKKYSYQKEVLLKALKIQIENENNTPLIVAGTYIFLSSSCCNLEEYDEALTWSQKALTICNKNNKDHNHAIAMANFYKAQALYGKKKKAKAIATMQQAFNGLKKSVGPDNNKTILAGKFLAQWQNR